MTEEIETIVFRILQQRSGAVAGHINLIQQYADQAKEKKFDPKTLKKFDETIKKLKSLQSIVHSIADSGKITAHQAAIINDSAKLMTEQLDLIADERKVLLRTLTDDGRTVEEIINSTKGADASTQEVYQQALDKIDDRLNNSVAFLNDIELLLRAGKHNVTFRTMGPDLPPF